MLIPAALQKNLTLPAGAVNARKKQQHQAVQAALWANQY